MTLQKDLDIELAMSLLEAEFLVDFWYAYSDEPAAPWPDRKKKKPKQKLERITINDATLGSNHQAQSLRQA